MWKGGGGQGRGCLLGMGKFHMDSVKLAFLLKYGGVVTTQVLSMHL